MSDTTAGLGVMVVDDDPMMRTVIAGLVESLGHRIVAQHERGRGSRRLYQSIRPDVVLLDIKMPDEDGVEALRRLMAAEPDAKVIMLTSMDDTSVAESCLSAGARDYVRKDAGAKAMREHLANALAALGGPAP